VAQVHIKNLDDTRLDLYRNVKDKLLALEHGLFLVEGEFLVRRLLASTFSVHSLLITNSRYNSSDWNIPENIPVYIASKEIISQIVGFTFHRGVLALGVRPQVHHLIDTSLLAYVNRLVVCPEINDVENLGSIMRTAAGLGYEYFLLGESCCDPLARRAIRTSIGAVFKLKIYASSNILGDLIKLKSDVHFDWHAAVLDQHAASLESIHPPSKVGVVFGSEANGLSSALTSIMDKLVTIPMSFGTDSLNVGVAAGIFLYHYRRK